MTTAPPSIEPLDVGTDRRVDLRPVDRVEITTVCDNIIDVLLVDEGPARRLPRRPHPPTVAAPTLEHGRAADVPLAQHGFSALVTVHHDGGTTRVLLDTGATPDGCVDNLYRLGIDPAEVDAIVLSHGHYDHATGLSGLAPVLGPRHVPIVVHPDAFAERRIAVPGRSPFPLARTDRTALTDAGFRLAEHRGPTLLADRTVLATGDVDRHTSFEHGLPLQEARQNDRWEPDRVMHDDQALVVDVSDRGLVVLTGCGHAGVVNICHHARALTGGRPLLAVLGGFHLGGPQFEAAIDPTVEALGELGPEVIVPTHCTGWKAIHAIADRMPDAFIQNSVGTTYDLRRS